MTRRSDVGPDDGPAVSGHPQPGSAAEGRQATRTGRGQGYGRERKYVCMEGGKKKSLRGQVVGHATPADVTLPSKNPFGLNMFLDQNLQRGSQGYHFCYQYMIIPHARFFKAPLTHTHTHTHMHIHTPMHTQRYAGRILHLVRRHHLLLVTLLLANAVAVETMPIFLSKLTSEVVAIVVSVTAVLLFGE